eukprot:6212597-Pleurochrysis_carterae.AAC.4
MERAAELARAQRDEISSLRKELKAGQRIAEGAKGECKRRDAVAEELRKVRARETTCVKKRARKLITELHEETRQLKESNALLAAAESRARASALKLLSFERTAAQKMRRGMRCASSSNRCASSTPRCKIATLKPLRRLLQARWRQGRRRRGRAAAKRVSAAAVSAADAATARHDELKEAVGIDARYNKVPDATFQGDSNKVHTIESWAKRSKRFVQSTLDGRLDTDEGARAVVKGIASAAGSDGMARLANTPEFLSMQKAAVADATDAIYKHWTARLFVHIWDRLGLSRSQMEMLRHLLSFVFNPEAGNTRARTSDLRVHQLLRHI